MSNDFSETLGLTIFAVLILSLLIEMRLSGTWNKIYFTSGLPIFIMRIPVGFRHSNIPASAQFERYFHSTWASSLVFKEIEPNTYAFREKFSEFRFFRYSPLMHGLLFFDDDKGEVVVKGIANWFALCFSLVWLGGVAQGPDLIITLVFVLFFALFMGLLYSIQYYRFSNVARFAAQTWKRKYLGDRYGV